jgi:hypothetical protein
MTRYPIEAAPTFVLRCSLVWGGGREESWSYLDWASGELRMSTLALSSMRSG